MPQYRVEISPNNRAGCKDTVCKANQVKIHKGEIRFGTWVEIDEHGSWGWKHWGCVSGSQMVNLQDACDQGNGNYDFDSIDGYDELNDHPEIQEKIRRCVKQGHIDLEDFNGDPEKNVPGEKGIRLTAKQKAAKEKAAAEDAATASEENTPAKKKAPAKRGRRKAANVDDDDEEPAAKKAKTVKPSKPTPSTSTRRKAPAQKAAVEDDGDAGVAEGEEATTKKPGRSSGKSNETSKARGKAADDAKGSGNKSRRFSKPAAQSSTEEDVIDSDEEPAPKSKGKRERKSKGGAVEPEADAEPVKTRRGRTRKT